MARDFIEMAVNCFHEALRWNPNTELDPDTKLQILYSQNTEVDLVIVMCISVSEPKLKL